MSGAASDTDRRHRRVVVAIAGCVTLAVIAVGLLLIIGIRHIPDFPGVREKPVPEVAGRLAMQFWDDDTGMCIDVEDIDTGERTRVLCEGTPNGPYAQPVGISWFGWTDDGLLMLASYEGPGVRLVTYDVDTDEVVSDETLTTDVRPPDRSRRDDGAVASTRYSDDGRAVVYVAVPGSERRVLYEVRGPDDYGFWAAEWSMRGDHVVVQDSQRRWIVLRAEGDPVPRILAVDVDRIAWYQPE